MYVCIYVCMYVCIHVVCMYVCNSYIAIYTSNKAMTRCGGLLPIFPSAHSVLARSSAEKCECECDDSITSSIRRSKTRINLMLVP